ncbi:TPA: DUF551 domain-containing protein [Escherichia coli]|jgi:hypothetical protein|nr:DUF551 domain-containing protein [Escherichia coli]
MTTITKERLLTIKQWRETYGPGSNVVLPAEEAEELARIALASLEAEPVAKIIAHYPLGIDVGKQKFVQAIGELPDFGGYLFAAPPAPIALEAIENAIEYIRSIAFHIDEDDYHGKHIAYFMRQALAWLEGHSCSNDRLGKAENQPVRGNQAAESNRGNEWTGNPDIDNAIIMLDRIDTLESCDDDRIEAVKAVLRRLAGNSPVIPDGLSTVCAEAYQVVGVMADALGVFGDAAVQKVLDNLSQQKLVHRDVLPFSLPVTPDGWVMVPKKLTAENGAKGVLSGEFSETTFISCPECFGDDDCDTCDGSGRIEIKVPVTWTTIKSIWDKGIAHFAAKPPQEVNRG